MLKINGTLGSPSAGSQPRQFIPTAPFAEDEQKGKRFGLYNKNFQMDHVMETVESVVEIRRRQVTLTIKYGPFFLSGQLLKDTFVLEIDFSSAENDHSSSLPLNGFGKGLCYDYANAAAKLARDFCRSEGLMVNNELNHWPVLQFIVSRTP